MVLLSPLETVLLSPQELGGFRGGIFFGQMGPKYYYFSVCDDHTYSLDLISPTIRNLAEWKKPSARTTVSVLLGVTVQQSDVDLYVDSQHIKRLSNLFDVSGSIGIALGDPKVARNSEARYSQLKVWVK